MRVDVDDNEDPVRFVPYRTRDFHSGPEWNQMANWVTACWSAFPCGTCRGHWPIGSLDRPHDRFVCGSPRRRFVEKIRMGGRSKSWLSLRSLLLYRVFASIVRLTNVYSQRRLIASVRLSSSCTLFNARCVYSLGHPDSVVTSVP